MSSSEARLAYNPPELTMLGHVSALTQSTLQVSDLAKTSTIDPDCPDDGLWFNLSTVEYKSGAAPWPGPSFQCYVPYVP